MRIRRGSTLIGSREKRQQRTSRRSPRCSRLRCVPYRRRGIGLSSAPLAVMTPCGAGHEKTYHCDRTNSVGRHRRRAGADLSVTPNHHRRPIPAGRIDRRGRADHGREDAAIARPAGHHRKRRRRRRQHRGRAGRACGARRLHDRHRPMGHPRRQHHLSFELRSAEGFRADRADLRQSAAHGRQKGAAGGRPEGACRLDEGKPRQGHVRQPECGGDRCPAFCCSN